MKNSIRKEYIDKLLSNSTKDVELYGDKTTIVKVTLPNGFVIVESSSCIDPKNFDMKTGENICMKKIVDKIWELEGYQLQTVVSQTEKINEDLKKKSKSENKKIF